MCMHNNAVRDIYTHKNAVRDICTHNNVVRDICTHNKAQTQQWAGASGTEKKNQTEEKEKVVTDVLGDLLSHLT